MSASFVPAIFDYWKNKMGTNYYYRYNKCPCCDRYDELHIGKKSSGWQFSFYSPIDTDFHIEIRSYENWRNFMNCYEGYIYDEYGQIHTIGKFDDMVMLSLGESRNQFDYMKENGYNLEREWKDDLGFAFCSGEFS